MNLQIDFVMCLVFGLLSFVACALFCAIGELPSPIKKLPGGMIPDRENRILGNPGRHPVLLGKQLSGYPKGFSPKPDKLPGTFRNVTGYPGKT